MSVREIVIWPDPRLGEVCAEVARIDRGLIEDMFETMYAAKGRGLAAPQIGVMHRLFVVDVAWKDGPRDPHVFINPVLEDCCDDIVRMEEGCLSIPDLPMPVERPRTARLTWQTADGAEQTGRFDGILARCILHELDHLDGRVILDHQAPADRSLLEAEYAG